MSVIHFANGPQEIKSKYNFEVVDVLQNIIFFLLCPCIDLHLSHAKLYFVQTSHTTSHSWWIIASNSNSLILYYWLTHCPLYQSMLLSLM